MNRPTALPPWLPTAPCTPGRCAAHPDGTGPDPGAGLPRALARLAAGTGTVLLGVLLAPAAALLPPAARLALVRLWTRTAVRAFGVRVRYEGTPAATGPLLVVANHVSWLDVPLLAAVLPARAVAKAEVRHWPVLGLLTALGGTLFIDRDRLRALPGTVRAMAGILAGGGRVAVFPEGSTWCGRERGRFRPAAFQAALDAGCAVQPVRIDYRPADAAAYVGDDPLGASLWRVVTTRRLTAEVRLADPLPSGRYPDRRALAAAAQRAVALRGAARRDPDPRVPAQRAVARDSANLSPPSVHQRARSRPAAASSSRTPS
ncbi:MULTISPECIES: lysophospholipid acyltransferase family protein [unclassified Streptomyces]|uniref:lysophospholipid acyltransferase family protein n=1 Tax=unclassified Streptomyces TaxID=2593676 RepID=UPI0006AF3228|nr:MULTISPECIES: lysophospholipid acyltransferase family protein [unclassified Streptomyces]KOX22719.1 acyltransferase [Streptomyces sp. NRRL F-6491]KOX39641.1 acyltransferase [Streptomyces sp. NRRL F-6492]